MREITERANETQMSLRRDLSVYSVDKRWLRLPNGEPVPDDGNFDCENALDFEVEIVSKDEFVQAARNKLGLPDDEEHGDSVESQLVDILSSVHAIVYETVTEALSTGILFNKLNEAMKIHNYEHGSISVGIDQRLKGLDFNYLNAQSCRVLNRLSAKIQSEFSDVDQVLDQDKLKESVQVLFLGKIEETKRPETQKIDSLKFRSRLLDASLIKGQNPLSNLEKFLFNQSQVISIDFITAVIQQFLTSEQLQSFGQRKRKLTELEAHGLD